MPTKTYRCYRFVPFDEPDAARPTALVVYVDDYGNGDDEPPALLGATSVAIDWRQPSHVTRAQLVNRITDYVTLLTGQRDPDVTLVFPILGESPDVNMRYEWLDNRTTHHVYQPTDDH